MRRTIAGSILVFLIVGCSTESTEPAPSTVADRAGAPLVTAPRDLTSRAADPCASLLSAKQVRRFGYDAPGDPNVDVLGIPTCAWRKEDEGRSVIVSVVVNRDLFVDTYRNRFLPVFRPLRIDDLPAVDVMSAQQSQTCTTTVGVADGQSLELNTSVGGGTDGVRDGDPCEEGHQVAEEIVSTLPRR